jgi:hypothetical protein
MKNLKSVANNVTVLSPSEQSLLKGGRRRYFIGDREVSFEDYKREVDRISGTPSVH